jgi:branched-chain amino acid transport system permease protein
MRRTERPKGDEVSTLVLTLIIGLGLGALYFLVASGLSLIYGLMHVLNFAHGAFLTLSAFVGWAVAQAIGVSSWGGFLLSVLAGALAGAVFAALTELILIRPLYERHIEQVLVTVGLSFAAIALFEGIWGTDPVTVTGPAWLGQTTSVLGASIPNKYWVLIIAAGIVLTGLVLFLKKTRYGMIIRAGVENRAMVTALGIDVRRSFTLVFAIGGAAAGIGGVLAMHAMTYVSAHLGSTLLIFAFIVTVVGGLGSLTGAAVASVLVAVLQQVANTYLGGTGDFIVVILLAVVLLVRPAGLMGKRA